MQRRAYLQFVCASTTLSLAGCLSSNRSPDPDQLGVVSSVGLTNEDADEHVVSVTVERNDEMVLDTEATLAPAGNGSESRFSYDDFETEPAEYTIEAALEDGGEERLSPDFTASDCSKNYYAFVEEDGRLSSFYSEANCG